MRFSLPNTTFPAPSVVLGQAYWSGVLTTLQDPACSSVNRFTIFGQVRIAADVLAKDFLCSPTVDCSGCPLRTVCQGPVLEAAPSFSRHRRIVDSLSRREIRRYYSDLRELWRDVSDAIRVRPHLRKWAACQVLMMGLLIAPFAGSTARAAEALDDLCDMIQTESVVSAPVDESETTVHRGRWD